MPLPIPPRPDPIGVWAVNPANGHVYKKIQCKSWEDARAMAIAEGAHLVSINDEAEQEWLVEKFGREPFLIGLTRPENQPNGSGQVVNHLRTRIGSFKNSHKTGCVGICEHYRWKMAYRKFRKFATYRHRTP